MKRSKVLFSALSAAFIGAAMLSTPAVAADGAKVFNKCKACHKLEIGKHGVGPSLAGVFGREAGKAEGYTKYRGLKGADWVWDEANLDAYLTDPRAFTEERTGTKSSMVLRLRKEEERAAVIEYLKNQ